MPYGNKTKGKKDRAVILKLRLFISVKIDGVLARRSRAMVTRLGCSEEPLGERVETPRSLIAMPISFNRWSPERWSHNSPRKNGSLCNRIRKGRTACTSISARLLSHCSISPLFFINPYTIRHILKQSSLFIIRVQARLNHLYHPYLFYTSSIFILKVIFISIGFLTTMLLIIACS